ncbi:hypothetical protein [Thauera sp. SDU_THAU2]|uniref:hypothetical protein n=1 Tax=Thauera sp. SDU_THAU2 TaxID=3136633 RepID=UPI00311E213E
MGRASLSGQGIEERIYDYQLAGSFTRLCINLLDTIELLPKSGALPKIEGIVSLIDTISRHLGFVAGIHGNKFATARRNAQKKHSSPKNEKAKAKEFVKTCWVEWEKQKDKYPSKEAFARDMLEKCEHLKSTKVITRWCKDWEEQAKKELC